MKQSWILQSAVKLCLPAGRFTGTAPPHCLQANTVYEIVFQVNVMPRRENKQWLISQDEKIGFCMSFYLDFLLIYHSAWHLGGTQWVSNGWPCGRMPEWKASHSPMSKWTAFAGVYPGSKTVALYISVTSVYVAETKYLITVHVTLYSSWWFFLIFHFRNPFVQLWVKYDTTFFGKWTNFTL